MMDKRAASAVLLLTLVSTQVSGACAADRTAQDQAAERYRSYAVEGIGSALAGARDLRERAEANDLAGAKKAWLSARAGWERSEVFTAGFVPELDALIDAWPNADSGFHAIEARLFGAEQTNVAHDADELVKNLDALHDRLRAMPLPLQGLLDGTVRLTYEIGESKADGGESRISGTSLDDMRNNVDGVTYAYNTIFADEVKRVDPALAGSISARLAQLKGVTEAPDLPHVDVRALRRTSEELVVALQAASLKLGLQRPTLEAQSR
jgi:iron uptake system EfeUOB component EfeO/EfeM